ncbi:hypothetical protein [Cetobacterium sp.]
MLFSKNLVKFFNLENEVEKMAQIYLIITASLKLKAIYQKIGLQIESITFMTIAGLQGAISSFIGQNYSAHLENRIKNGNVSLYGTRNNDNCSIYIFKNTNCSNFIKEGVFWVRWSMDKHIINKRNKRDFIKTP